MQQTVWVRHEPFLPPDIKSSLNHPIVHKPSWIADPDFPGVQDDIPGLSRLAKSFASSCRSALGVSADFSAAGLSARARLGSERVPEERRRPGAFHHWAIALMVTT